MLYLGQLLITNSCAHVTDHNMHQMVMSYADQHLFHLLLHTVTYKTMERFTSPNGLKKISVPEERDGGTKFIVTME